MVGVACTCKALTVESMLATHCLRSQPSDTNTDARAACVKPQGAAFLCRRHVTRPLHTDDLTADRSASARAVEEESTLTGAS